MLQNQFQFAGDHLLLSLLAFNVGIEVGQLVFLAVAIPLLTLVFAKTPLSERAVTVVISAFVAHTAWHWLVERWDTLAKVEWPRSMPRRSACGSYWRRRSGSWSGWC